MRAGRSKDRKRRSPHRAGEREGAKKGEEGLGSSFSTFLSLGPAHANWAGQACCWFYLRFSLPSWSSDLPLFYFCRLSLPGLLATAILDCFSLLSLPNTWNQSLCSWTSQHPLHSLLQHWQVSPAILERRQGLWVLIRTQNGAPVWPGVSRLPSVPFSQSR